MVKRRKPGSTAQPLPGTNGTCPYCRAGVMQLQRQCAGSDGPGWCCDNPACGYRTLVTPAQSFAERRRALVDRAARAHRQSMAALARADRLKRESRRLREAPPPHGKK